MPEQQQQDTAGRTGQRDDKDGAWSGRRDAIEPEEQTTDPPETPTTQAQRKQDEALASGEEQPG